MQIKADQLEAHLARGLKPLYTVHGDEPLLAQEAGDAIRNAAPRFSSSGALPAINCTGSGTMSAPSWAR